MRWWGKQAPDWSELRTEALTLLQREDRLQQIVKLVGPDVLPETQRLILFVAEILKDGFLAQSAFDEKDMYCTPERQIALLRIMLTLYRKGRELIQAAFRWRGCEVWPACRKSCAPSPPSATPNWTNWRSWNGASWRNWRRWQKNRTRQSG